MAAFSDLVLTAEDLDATSLALDLSTETLDLRMLDVRSLRESMLAWERTYHTTPFDPEGEDFRLFPGCYTIWSGPPGAGKTTLLRQMICKLMNEGHGVLVASMEESPKSVFWRMVKAATGTAEPTEEQLQIAAARWSKSLRIWSSEGTAEHVKLLAAIRVLGQRGEIKHAVIDNLMSLDVPSNDFEGHRLFAIALRNTVRASGVHVHLVAHPKKPQQAGQEPDQHDVAGGSDLVRNADNVLFVRREAGDWVGQTDTGMLVTCKKQRHGSGRTFNAELWFSQDIKQARPKSWPAAVTRYLPDHAYRAEARPVVEDCPF